MIIKILIIVFISACCVINYLLLFKRKRRNKLVVNEIFKPLVNMIKVEDEILEAPTVEKEVVKTIETKPELPSKTSIILPIEDIVKSFKANFTNCFTHACENKTAKYIFIDFETSDLPVIKTVPSKESAHVFPHVLQAGCLIFNDSGELIDSYNSIIKVHKHVRFNPVASKKNGLNFKICQEKGEDISLFYDFLKKYLNEHTYLIAHNLEFDDLFLKLEAIRNDIILPQYKTYCTMLQTTEIVGIKRIGYSDYKYPTLSELLAKSFFRGNSITVSSNHNAMADAKICALCFFKLNLNLDCS